MFKGYKLVEEKYVDDVDSKCILLEHEKTGARVFLMENSDNNKTFGIGFKTIPKDNTGICHIVEHAVLSGSKKFRTKEPFMDMYKTSLATYLNAMTFPDKTLYPIASQNEKDFANLMEVYLDAVFYPAMKEDERIFMQEGWHYELEDKNSDINIKGIVYSEMKGAYSTPETQLYFRNSNALCTDTVYAVESGGEPYTIPKLKFEDFCDFHTKYYHPSNAYIYLYGNCNFEERLEFLDREYLSKFDKKEFTHFEGVQKPFNTPKNVVDEYSISKDEDLEDKTFLMYSACIGESTGLKDRLILKILNSLLIENQGAYLTDALLKSKICEDVSAMYMESTKYLSFGVYAVNSNRENMNEFKNIVTTELEKLVKNGIDRKKIEAIFNKFEFSIRELPNSTSSGIEYFIAIFDSWLYGKSPIESLLFNDAILEIKDEILNNRLLEKTIEEKILNNNHKAYIILAPNAGLNDKKENAQKEWLKRYKNSLSKIQLNRLIEKTKNLLEYQMNEDSEENKQTIPRLSISDVDKEVEKIPVEIEKNNGVTVIKNKIFTSGINYVNLCFDLCHISKEEVKYISLIENLISSLDKKSMDYKEFSTEKYLNCGSIGMNIRTFRVNSQKREFVPKFIVSTRFLNEKIDKTIELIRILLTETLFTDKVRIKEELLAIRNELEQEVLGSGHAFGILRSKSYYSNRSHYGELLSGIDFIKFIQDICDNFDDRIDNVIEKMKFVYDRLFLKDNLILNIVTSDENVKLVEDKFIEFISNFKQDIDKYFFNFEKENLKEAISTSSDVNYVTFTADLKKYEIEYKGYYELITSMLSNSYLHNNIRAIGGAYGAGMSIDKEAILTLYSYRDPNIKSTKNIFREIGNYLGELEISKEDFEGFKISSTKSFFPLCTPVEKGFISLGKYISSVTDEEIQSQYEELLDCDIHDIKEFSEKIKPAFENEDNFVVVGNAEIIKENEEEFDNILKLKN